MKGVTWGKGKNSTSCGWEAGRRGRCWRRGKAPDTELDSGVIRVSKLMPGDEGVIVKIDTSDTAVLRKFVAMGVLPGCRIKVLRCTPSLVLKVDQTEFALDARIANAMLVKLDTAANQCARS